MAHNDRSLNLQTGEYPSTPSHFDITIQEQTLNSATYHVTNQSTKRNIFARHETRRGDESVRDDCEDDYVQPKQVSYEEHKMEDEHSDKSSCNAFSPREE